MSKIKQVFQDKFGMTPVVGMGLTVQMYTDRVTFTIISVSPKGFVATRDSVKRVDSNGMSDCQEYEYTHNPDGEIFKFRLGTKTGRYKCKIGYARLGIRNAYHDYSF